ncbi:hypothetical protein [Spongorhabdus nitratireducens]
MDITVATSVARSYTRYFLLIILLFSLAGCVSTSSVMKSWQGRSITDLIALWGAPTSHSPIKNGQHIYTWSTSWGSAYLMHTCRQSFVTNSEGDIQNWSFAGCPHWQMKLDKEKKGPLH